MADPINVIATAVASAIIAGFGTYVTTVLKIRRDLGAQYDSNLRQDRIAVYKELWKCLQPLARYAAPAPFTHGTAEKLATALRQWYFEDGGLFLSEGARDAYFALQDVLKTLGPGSDDPVNPEIVKLLIAKGSALRTKLCEDVGTRARAMLQWS